MAKADQLRSSQNSQTTSPLTYSHMVLVGITASTASPISKPANQGTGPGRHASKEKSCLIRNVP